MRARLAVFPTCTLPLFTRCESVANASVSVAETALTAWIRSPSINLRVVVILIPSLFFLYDYMP